MTDEDRLRVLSMATAGRLLTADMAEPLLMGALKAAAEPLRRLAAHVVQLHILDATQLAALHRLTRPYFLFDDGLALLN